VLSGSSLFVNRAVVLGTVLVTVVRTSAVRRGCPSGQIYVLVSVRKQMSDELDLSALVS